MTIMSLIRVTARRLPRSVLNHHQECRFQIIRAASTSIPHLSGHPGPTSSSPSTSQSNPSEEARKAAELMQKLREDPAYLKQIHDDQLMYTKPAGPDSLPGDRALKRGGTTSQQSN